MVQELWERGERERIDDYCMCDALDTYFVFLRCRVLQGAISIEQERELVARARGWMETQAGVNMALAEYLRVMGDWRAPGDDADGMLG